MPQRNGRSAFDRPRAIRDGVGDKPPRVPTVVLSGANPAVTWGSGNVVRIIADETATGSAVISHGRYDGQAILLLTIRNDTAIVTLPDDVASNVVLSGGAYGFDVNSILMLVWDARQLLWIESPRGIVGPEGPAGADGVDSDTTDLLELIRWAFRRIAFLNAALDIKYDDCDEAVPDSWQLVEDDAWM